MQETGYRENNVLVSVGNKYMYLEFNGILGSEILFTAYVNGYTLKGHNSAIIILPPLCTLKGNNPSSASNKFFLLKVYSRLGIVSFHYWRKKHECVPIQREGQTPIAG